MTVPILVTRNLRKPEKKGRFRRLLPKAFALFIAIVFSIAVCEVVVRVVGYRPPLTDQKLYLADQSGVIPYVLRPNYETFYLGEDVHIDADGYRVVTRSLPNLQPRTSLLILGDSVVFGHGLADNNTIASQLQNSSLALNKQIFVRNIGVPGYTSWNEYAALLKFFEKHSVDMVFLIYVANDVSFDNDQLGIARGRFSLLSDSYFNRGTNFMYRHLFTSYLISNGFKGLARSFSANAQPGMRQDYLDEAAMNYSMQALSQIQQLCSSRGIQFIVGIYRDVSYYGDPVQTLDYERRIKTKLDDHKISSVLLASHISELKMSEVRVFLNDPHPSAKAAGIIAREIGNEVSKSW